MSTVPSSVCAGDHESDPADWPSWVDRYIWNTTDDDEPESFGLEPPAGDPFDLSDLTAADLAAADAALEDLPFTAGDTFDPSPADWASACELFRRAAPLRSPDGSIEPDIRDVVLTGRFSLDGLTAFRDALNHWSPFES